MTLTSKGPIRIGSPNPTPDVPVKTLTPVTIEPSRSIPIEVMSDRIPSRPDPWISISTRGEYDCIGIIGPAGSGKTRFACQFPKPLLYDFDRKAPAGIETLPFWKDEFVKSIKPSSGLANRRDALRAFLELHARSYPNHTHILDSWTLIQSAFDEYTEFEKPRDTGKDAVFSFFRKKIEYSEKICSLLRGLPVTVIVTMHETPERNDDGGETGKLKPLMEGKFADALPGRMTDFYRLVINPIDVDFQTGQPRKDDKTGRPLELRANCGRYLQVTPSRAFTPVLGQHKMEYILSNKISFLPATYEDWKKFSGITT